MAESQSGFGSYRASAAEWVTVFGGRYYPDFLTTATEKYGSILAEFVALADGSTSSADLLRAIAEESNPTRTQLQRVFRQYVSPNTPVEMLKVKSKVEDVIRDWGANFRDILEVRHHLEARGQNDEALFAILHEYQERGQKGYDLSEAFFDWVEKAFEGELTVQGPRRAGPDVLLSAVLDGYEAATPADFILRDSENAPRAVGFLRYDSDRGGAQEDDRIGSYRGYATRILDYADTHGAPLKVIFVNDGPGLLLGSMWDDYASLEAEHGGRVIVATLRMLDARLTLEWILRSR